MLLQHKFGGKCGRGLPNPKWRKYKGIKSLKKSESPKSSNHDPYEVKIVIKF